MPVVNMTPGRIDMALSGPGTVMSIRKCSEDIKLLVYFSGSQQHVYLMANWSADFSLMESFQNKNEETILTPLCSCHDFVHKK